MNPKTPPELFGVNLLQKAHEYTQHIDISRGQRAIKADT